MKQERKNLIRNKKHKHNKIEKKKKSKQKIYSCKIEFIEIIQRQNMIQKEYIKNE